MKCFISRSKTIVGNIIYSFSSQSERKIDTFSKRLVQMVDGVQLFQNQKHKVINVPTKVLDIKY